MLGSRYLNPYFGSGIYTWAALISTVLAALTAGYFLGGFIADRTVSASVLGAIVSAASLYLLALPSFADVILGIVSNTMDDVRLGSLTAALAIMVVPVALFGVYSPFAIRLVLRAAQHSGTVSGTVYGVSTAGSIAGTLGTTFFLIPTIGTRAITLLLGAAGLCCGLLLFALGRRRGPAKGAAVLAAFALLVLGGGRAWSDDVIDANVRAQMLKHGDGRVAHLETEYNNLFIDKHGSMLGLSSMHSGRPNYIESIVDLKDPDAMPVPYNQTMTAALAYPKALKRILMIGLGAGSISTYLGRAMPDAQIDVVELDPGVISAGKDYFGLRETDKVSRSRHSIPSADAGILWTGQRASRSRRRHGVERRRQHEALSVDSRHLGRGISDRGCLSRLARSQRGAGDCGRRAGSATDRGCVAAIRHRPAAAVSFPLSVARSRRQTGRRARIGRRRVADRRFRAGRSLSGHARQIAKAPISVMVFAAVRQTCGTSDLWYVRLALRQTLAHPIPVTRVTPAA
jgi:MFS family permease